VGNASQVGIQYFTINNYSTMRIYALLLTLLPLVMVAQECDTAVVIQACFEMKTKRVEPFEAFEVTKMPEFPGGQAALNKFISENFRYPAEICVEGRVIVGFVIDETGYPVDPYIIRDLGGSTGAEAIRVVNMMPCWVPGEMAGKPVKVKFTLPIRVYLE
jgi:hypothetical protein